MSDLKTLDEHIHDMLRPDDKPHPNNAERNVHEHDKRNEVLHIYNTDVNCASCNTIARLHHIPRGTTLHYGCPKAKVLLCSARHAKALQGPPGPIGPTGIDSAAAALKKRRTDRIAHHLKYPKAPVTTSNLPNPHRLAGYCSMCGSNNTVELSEFILPVWYHNMMKGDYFAGGTQPRAMTLCHSCQREIADMVLSRTHPELPNRTLEQIQRVITKVMKNLTNEYAYLFDSLGIQLYDERGVSRPIKEVLTELCAAWDKNSVSAELVQRTKERDLAREWQRNSQERWLTCDKRLDKLLSVFSRFGVTVFEDGELRDPADIANELSAAWIADLTKLFVKGREITKASREAQS